uniref:FAT atypical cadherin 1 n=1 Tax=Ursus maritimus TaxID=29073 RepID=A0A452U765_URSMA
MGSPLVFLPLLLLLLQHFGDGDGSQTLAQTPLQFTQFQYNVTVHENSAAKTYVGHPVKMGIYLTNPLWELRYKIVSGDNENLFKAEEYILGDFCFLRIRTKGGNTAILNREVKDHYTLIVKAVEKNTNAEARAKVRVQVLDTNDLRPTSVARVSATDADIGTNGEFYYSFKDRTDMFAIHPTSGAVVLTGRLDYAETKLYELEILAVDRGMKLYGSSGVSSMAKLTVHVEQANGCAPVLTAVTLSPSELDKDPTYAIVTVDDCDQGPNGEIASLSIVAGDLLQQFRTVRSSPGSKEYKVKAVGAIDWDSHPFGYNLTLQAKDKGTPPQFSSVKVIRVTSPQFRAGPVKFEKDVYRAEISEFAPSNTPVVMVKATPSYSHLRYVFKSTPGKAKFSLNHNTGLISILEPIKRQQASHFELEVTTSDRRASTRVLVKVLSANSNPPEFTQTAYKASFDENVPIGTTVMSVSAVDPDEGENGYVTYSIANLNHVPFIINHFTGAVSTSEDLDYELMPRVYTLRIRASDWGLPYRREVEVLATVTLSNLNDNTPLFEKINCEGTIPRDLGVGEQIATVSAIDADELQLVRYQIEAGNDLDLFSLNPNSGVLSLKRSLLDGLGTRVSFHSLRITATDGENFATPSYINLTVAASRKPVHLQCEETGVAKMLAEKLLQANKLHSQGEVEDIFFDSHSVNAHAPQFRSTLPAGIEVKENRPVGSSIIFMNATDLDTGFNGKLVYAISGGNEDSCFIIDTETGMLKILSPLDRETTDKYTLNITVSDLGIPQKAAWRLLDVRVLDANDNPPEFLQESYFVEVSEDKEINSEIIQVEATDKDLGPNGHVTYSILTDTDKFSIDSVTGVVKTTYPLDREVQHVHYLKIEARDQAREEPQLLSTVLLKVSLEDVNDNPPKFMPPNYLVKVREDLPEGTIIMWLEASDPDLGPSSQVRYSLLDHGEGHFDVDKLSGAVRIVQHLDFEKKQVYNLTVRAKDKGKPVSLSSTCYVEVEVIDVNENLHPPVFSSFVEKAVVKEDVPVGFSIMTVSAHDEDTGRDGEVCYSIRDGSGVGVFRIDEETGKYVITLVFLKEISAPRNIGNSFTIDPILGSIKTARELDRESRVDYDLMVKATDRGNPPMSEIASVRVVVTIADNASPKFTSKEYSVEISETVGIGSFVGMVTAHSQSSVVYEIKDGNIADAFDINPHSGSIITQKALDFETLPVYTLIIQGTNMAGLSSNTTVVVHLQDENDNLPVFAQAEYTGLISESASINSVVLTDKNVPLVIRATDADRESSALLVYHIVEPSLHKYFAIDSSTGAIHTVLSLDYEETSTFHFTVQVHDMGTPRLFAEYAANVTIRVIDINDCPPVFSKSLYEASLLLPTYRGVKVITVNATDADSSAFSQLMYSITEGNIGEKFFMDHRTGAITVQNTTQLRSRYELTVRASDGRFVSFASVKINVKESKESQLKFTQDFYSAVVKENSTEARTLAVITAIGNPINEPLFYQILNPDRRFKISRTSGVLSTTGIPFDREQQEAFDVVVEVTQEQKPSAVAHVVVRVIIEDQNDNAPVFVNLPYYAVVKVDAVVGHVIRYVTAVDRDSGRNGEVHYYLKEHHEHFQIGSAGEISLKKQFEPDTLNKEYLITVVAKDGGNPAFSAEVIVPITVMNKAMPVFEKPFYSAEVPENIQLHSPVVHVQANSPEGLKVFYSITDGDPFSQFTINFNTGVINVIAPLDFESHPAYKLSIRATDSLTGAHADVFADIIVEDINDNPPVFVHHSYATTLSEASVIGTSVIQVRATDSDSEPNRGISYHMFGNHSKSHDHFHIDSSTGLISLVRTLDYEQFQQHKIFVRAVDGGMPPLSSDVIITVDVTDLNDNPPLFDQQIYEARISEHAIHGHFVTCVKAYDADSSDVDKLDYSILSGNDHKNFVIDSETGIITLSNLRRHSLKPFYSLNVSVSDGVFRSSAQVHITVIGGNLHSPVFPQSEYEVELAENAPLHTLVIEVKATDGDSGIYGHITYHIVNDFAKDRFYTNERGQIFTLEKLDRETPAEKVISVRLMAKDAGGKVAFCTINVILTDDNDNAPQFRATRYEVDIGSSAPKGTSVIKVLASDADEGSNADVTYAIEADSESVKENLEINKLSGIITTKESLIGLENEFFTFFVRAVDSGSPSRESVVPVYVKILPPEIQLPKFSEPFYTYTVSEDMPIGTEIDLLRAEHSGTVLYSLIKGNTPESNRDEFFVIDRQSGRLKLEKSLDHEITKWYQFSILARCTHDDYEVVASVDVSIQVKDANDNSPVLESNPYEAFIVENLPGGSRVIQVRASDLDSGTNGQVMYSLDQSQSMEVIECFAINVETGWITTLKELDHEKRDSYQIQVVASDHGEKVQLSSTAVVDVTVTDVNDSPPRFTAEIYKGTVSEDDPPGGVIAILSTTDADSEEINRQVTYYITGGDPLGQFAIENIQNEWKVYVKKPLDREKRDNYLLTITATDGTFSSKAIVEVKVLDANDNSPVCEKTLYSDTVPEDASPGKLILQVSATDADIRSNAEITYTLLGPGAEKFRLNPDTGELKTSAPLDREEQAVYNLLVKATDGGGRSCQANLVLTLEDVNDNAPEFSADPYTITVFENTEPGTLLTRVQATDADSGLNRKISYSLINSADGQFSINELSGIIQLEKPLDREQQAVYSLTLKAVDQGLPRRLTATGTVVVSVLDINDNPPVFEYREYGATVSEDVLIGTEVLQVYAASRDIEANAEITYSIMSGNEHGKFSIDSRTGAIFVIENLDYESSREYYLTVEAADGGTPSLSDVATVSINVTDINDNSPVFSQDTYTAVISEDALLEQSVITVMADDADGPSNSHIRYSIIDGNQGSPFTIDPTRGEVKVTKLLDRETISGYTLTVQASDNGSPPRVNTTTVNIDVSDVNDNAPVFSKGNYSVIIQENKPVGFSVLQLVVSDKDSSHNGPPFFFTVVSGNDDGAFEVNQQGVLLTSAAIKRKVKDHYLLHVKVADNGKPPLSSLTYIDIRIIEESIYPPAILPLEIFITAFGEEYSGGVIGKIHATDQDVYDTLTYSLDPQMDQLFSVSSTGGKLIAHKKLDVGQYLLNVSVTDGKFTTVADITVHIRQITQEMLNHTIAVRFANLTPEEFVGDYWRNFQRALRNILGVRRSDIQIVSLQPSEPQPHLDVLLFVEKSGSAQGSTKQLLHKVNSSVTDIEDIIGVRILDVFQKLCAGLDCPWKFCDEKVTVDENVMSTHSTARLSFVTPRHHRAAVCLCKEGKCPLVHHGCEDSPCPEGSECVTDPGEDRYTCVCPGGKFGQCPGERTSSVTFTGNSFVKYRLMENENKLEMKLTMRLRTYSAHAVVMYARGTDYSILEIHNGRLQYKFDCGSGPGIVSVQSIQVHDGLWHAVSLEVNGNYARLVLDQVHTASGTAPGTLKTLNLDNHVFFGGHIRQQGGRHGRSPQVGNGFRGCMDSIYLNGQELPLNNKPRSYAHIEEWVDVSPGCFLTATEDCSSSPCQNGGVCHPSPTGGYYCKCSALYIGTYCELSINPCSSNPCLYGGTCIADNGDFVCHCRGLYTGQRCQLSPYCKDEPCKNGGTCFDSLDGAVCQCDSGFRGERCQSDVDECAASPCRNGALCENTHGSYHCNCSRDYRGRHCEDATPNQYVSTPWNIGLAEGVGILVFIMGIFLLVMVFVLCRKMISRKKKHQAEPEDKHLGPTAAFLQRPYFDAKLNKNIYSDVPPQVPVRPISYTPSIPSDSRNNLDRNSFEGSAIPEHPEFSTFNPESVHGHRKAVAVCSVAPNLPPPPPSNSPSDSDSIQKPSWDFDYDTKVVDLDPCLSKKPLEEKPSHPYSARESLSEVQSLSSFQSESCDDNGYHWDTSDWMPSVPLPDIQEFPNYEVIDEQTPLYSADPDAIDTDYYPGGYDLESDFPPPPEDFPVPDELPPLPPEFSDQFESIHPPRDMPAAGSLGSSSRNRKRFHLNQYLPNFYPVDVSEPQKAGPGENSTCREPYAPYPPGYSRNFEAPSVENMPMSVYASTASCSDVSACCEVESEVMMSDYESGEDGHFDEVTVPPLDVQQHTQV